MHDPSASTPTRIQRVGRAFRWRLEWPCSANDLVQVVEESDCLLVVMAGAGEDGFSICWAPGSRLLLDQFVSAWKGSAGNLQARLEACADYVREHFLAGTRALERYIPEDDLGGPHGTFAALAIGNDQAAAAWMGGYLMLRVRGLEPVWATTPHDLEHQYAAAGVEVPAGSLPDVIIRCISDGVDATPDVSSTSVQIGDLFVVASSRVQKRLGKEQIASIAALSDDPEEAAAEMVRLACEDASVWSAAACVVRI